MRQVDGSIHKRLRDATILPARFGREKILEPFRGTDRATRGVHTVNSKKESWKGKGVKGL